MLRTIFILVFLTLSCGEKKPKIQSTTNSTQQNTSQQFSNNQGPLQNTNLPIPSGVIVDAQTGNSDICSNISNYITANLPQLKSKFDLLCGQNFISNLRNPKVIFREDGNPSPIVNQAVHLITQENKISDKQSSLKMSNSMLVNTDPKSYFNMIRLQISRPEEFKGPAQFENNPDSEITTFPGKVSNLQAEYHFIDLTDKPDTIVEYNAISRFIPIVNGQLYIIASEKIEGKCETLCQFTSLTIIHINTNTTTEVFSISDNLYDNGGDHEETMKKARKNVAHGMERNLRNSRKAQNANSFFND